MYSIIYFEPYVSDAIVDQLVQKIKSGIKCFFFTKDVTNEINENPFLSEAIKCSLLYVFVVDSNSAVFNERFSYYNGEVSDEMLGELADANIRFNKEQYKIEHAPMNGNIIVKAGAGTGKTTVMIDRLFYLRQQFPDIPFDQMVVVTFTNEAVSNMRNKLLMKLRGYFKCTNNRKYLQWMEELRDMPIGTIHSFAKQILPSNQSEYSFGNTIKIKGFRYRRRLLIEEIIDKYSWKFKELFKPWLHIPQFEIVKIVEQILDSLNNHAIQRTEYENLHFGQNTEAMNHLLDYLVKETNRKLFEIKTEEGYLDVNDLISELKTFYSTNKMDELNYKMIMIDEFQDTDYAQVTFFAWLSKQINAPLFVVGDIKQSIYRFRGADYTAFQQLEELVHIPYHYTLKNNYRSDQKLLDHLNRVFEQFPKFVDSFHYSEKDRLQAVKENDTATVGLIKRKWYDGSDFIKTLEEYQYKDAAILVRSNREVMDMASLLTRKRIAFRTVQDGTFYRSYPVREFYLLIRRFVQPTIWKNRLALHMSSYGDCSANLMGIIQSYSSDKLYIEPILSDLDLHLKPFEEQLNQRPIFEILEDLIDSAQPAKRYAKRYYDEKRKLQPDISSEQIKKEAITEKNEYEMNLKKLIILLKEVFRNSIPTLLGIERHLAISMAGNNTESVLTNKEDDTHRIKIMTVHKSKGLEFDYVFIPNTRNSFDKFAKIDILHDYEKIGYSIFINDNQIKNQFYQSTIKDEKLERIGEETRLLYVAMTRAKKGLLVHSPDQTNNHSIKSWTDLIVKGSDQFVSS